jgi:murE/murF fusion protein
LVDTGFTTPEATTLMRFLADFADQEAQACALEASSIGIAEGRLDGARVDVAVFTNLTRDHLDYHGTMEQYAQAKARLFTWPRLRLAVSNLDDPCGRELAALSTATKVVGYTQQDRPTDRQATIRAERGRGNPRLACVSASARRVVGRSSRPACSVAITCPICWPWPRFCSTPA